MSTCTFIRQDTTTTPGKQRNRATIRYANTFVSLILSIFLARACFQSGTPGARCERMSLTLWTWENDTWLIPSFFADGRWAKCRCYSQEEGSIPALCFLCRTQKCSHSHNFFCSRSCVFKYLCQAVASISRLFCLFSSIVAECKSEDISVLLPCCFLFKGFYSKPMLLLESSCLLQLKTNVSLFNFFFILERGHVWYLRVLTTFLRPKHDETNSVSHWLDSKHQRYVSSVQNWSNHVSSNKPLSVGPRCEHVESVRFVQKSAWFSPAHLKSIHLRLGGTVLCNCIRWRPLPDMILCVCAYSAACVANNKAAVTVLLLTLPVFNVTKHLIQHEVKYTFQHCQFLTWRYNLSVCLFFFLLSSYRRSAPTLSVSCSPTTAPTSWPVVPVPSSQCVPSLTWGTEERWAKDEIAARS